MNAKLYWFIIVSIFNIVRYIVQRNKLYENWVCQMQYADEPIDERDHKSKENERRDNVQQWTIQFKAVYIKQRDV